MLYARPPIGRPQAVLGYLSRDTHRVAISNHRLISLDERGVTFRYKDYRRDGAERRGRSRPKCQVAILDPYSTCELETIYPARTTSRTPGH